MYMNKFMLTCSARNVRVSVNARLHTYHKSLVRGTVGIPLQVLSCR